MIQRTLRKFFPSYASLPLCITGLGNLFAYQGAKLLQEIFDFQYFSIATAWDDFFAFDPTWVVIYILSYIFWAYQYITVAKDSPQKAYQLACADAVAKLICFICFICLPVTLERPEVNESGLIPFLMRTIYKLDTPTNLLPSAHCFIAWLGTRYMFECKKLRFKWLTCTLCLIGSILVFLSTLHTKQHVLWDVAAGVAVAEIGWLVARFTSLPSFIGKLNEKFMKTKLSRIL